MSDKSYYVRLRGKVLGPFRTDQLRALRDRGQLGRFHEVSEDRRNWAPATSVSEVFPPDGESMPATAVAYGQAQNAPPPEMGPPNETAQWYYLDAAGGQHGPVMASQLETLRLGGVIGDDSLVWRAGLAEWIAYASAGVSRLPPDGSFVVGATRGRGARETADVVGTMLGWRKVRSGLTLAIVAAFLLLGAGALFGLWLIEAVAAQHWSDASAAVLILILVGLVVFAAQVVEAVGFGFCAAAPPASGARGLAITSLVLAIVHPFLTIFMSVAIGVVGSAVPWHVEETHAALALVYCLEAIIWIVALAKPFLFQMYLRMVAGYHRAQVLAQQTIYLMIMYGVGVFLSFVFVLVAALSPALAEWRDRHALAGQALVLALLALASFFVWLGWFVWYVIVLFRTRSIVHQSLTQA